MLTRVVDIGRKMVVPAGREVGGRDGSRAGLGGNRGLRREHNLERHHRDAITARAHGLQSHMIRTILGRQSINASAG